MPIIITSQNANKTFASYFEYNLRRCDTIEMVFFKTFQTFIRNFSYFFSLKIAQRLRGIYLKDINLKGFQRNDSIVSLSWCYVLQVFLFRIFSNHKVFFAGVCFLMINLTWQNFAKEKWQHEVAQILCGFAFVLFGT